MFTPSDQLTLFGNPEGGVRNGSTPSSADSHASPTALQGKASAKPTSATSGPSSAALLPSSSRGGSWAKTCRDLIERCLPTSSVTLKHWVTKSGCSVWRLLPSERRIAASGGSSLGDGWPTPNANVANDGETAETWMARHQKHAEKENPTRSGMPLSIATQLWPTATTRDYKGAYPETSLFRKDGKSRERDLLPNAVLAKWPTPTTSDAKASGAAAYSTASGRHSGTTLTDATVRAPETWSTPRAACNVAGQKTMRPPSEGGSSSKPGLEQQARTWATPRAEGFDAGNHPGAQDSLDAQTKHWPTPQARDEKGGFSKHSRGGADLVTSATGQNGRASLNPDWVGQLMGFPDGWLDLDQEALGRIRPARKRSGKRRESQSES